MHWTSPTPAPLGSQMEQSDNQPAWMSDNTSSPPLSGYRPPGAYAAAVPTSSDGWKRLAVKIVVIGMAAMMTANGIHPPVFVNLANNVISMKY